MKVIFLDFDGVINNFNHFDGVDYDNVKWLLEIVKQTDAKFVATTSNKYSFQRNNNINYENTIYYRFVTILKEMGVDIFDVTPYVYGDKKSEIMEYLKTHNDIEQFLVLDDMFVGDDLKEHQVLVDKYTGLSEECVIPAINILNGKLGFYSCDFNFVKRKED